VVEAICAMLTGDDEPSFDETCANPAFLQMLSHIRQLVLGTASSRPCVIEGSPGVILLMPSMSTQFDAVCGYTSCGLVAVGPPHAKDYFEKWSGRAAAKQVSSLDWRNLAAFTYNLYLAHPTSEYFNSAFAAYCRILTDTWDLPETVIHEAAARVVTLCRLGIGTDIANLSKNVQTHRQIFGLTHGDVWRFWIHQLVELSRIPWFADTLAELFKEISYRAITYAQKDNTGTFKELTLRLQNHPAPQTGMMDAFQQFAQILFNINFEDLEHQQSFATFIRESIVIKDPSNIDLLALRLQSPSTAFTRILSHLTMR
jgi:hypothetical protein